MVFEDLINVFPFIWNWMYQNREFDRFTTDIAEPLSDRGTINDSYAKDNGMRRWLGR
jgi:hypothetical protein